MDARTDPRSLLAGVRGFARDAHAAVNEVAAAEYVAESPDGLVTATRTSEATTITLHVTAKRRLDREDLGITIVQTVQAAEERARQAAAEAISATLAANLPDRPELLDQMRERMRQPLPWSHG